MTSERKQFLSQVFKEANRRAWYLARQGAKKFGGKPSQYFRAAIKETYSKTLKEASTPFVPLDQMPIIPYEVWSRNVSMYRLLEDGTRDHPSDAVFLIVNWQPDDYNADMKYYLQWKDCDDVDAETVNRMIALCGFISSLNGQRVDYINNTGWVYVEKWDKYKAERTAHGLPLETARDYFG